MSADVSIKARLGCRGSLCTTAWTSHWMQVTPEKGGLDLGGQLPLTEDSTREGHTHELSAADITATTAYVPCTKVIIVMPITH